MASTGPSGRRRVVVIGAGAVGLACAHALAGRGAEVVLLERDEIGAGCSSGNAGWICPVFAPPVPGPGVPTMTLKWMLRGDSPLYVRPRLDPALARWLLDFWRHCRQDHYQRGTMAVGEFSRDTMSLWDNLAGDGVSLPMEQRGILFLSLSARGLRPILEEIEAMRPFGYGPPTLLGGDGVRAFEPAVGQEVSHGVFVSGERHVRPEALLRGLAERVAELGVLVRTGAEVLRLERDGPRVVGAVTADGIVEGDEFVVATGAWSPRLVSGLGFRLPIQGGKGYSLTVERPALAVGRPLYLVEGKVACTPFDGALRMAGTMEFSGLDSSPDPRRMAAVRRTADRYLPGWTEGGPVAEWSGPRPMTPDGLPIIGRAPGLPNLLLATGHGMLGVTLAPATGAAIADLALGSTSGFDLRPFDPARFA